MFAEWLAALEERHLADLRVQEVTRALRALSSAYVQRRHKVTSGATLDSAGKRAAFALYYAPLHFLMVDQVVRALGATAPLASILDLGCGTGAAGSAWAAASATPAVTGIDRHPWALDEARWTYRHFGLRGQTRQGDLSRLPPVRAGSGIVAAFVLNELAAAARATVEDQLVSAAANGVSVLILEPLARGVAPWWDAAAARMRASGGRADEWRFSVELPPTIEKFDRAAGLDHRELTVRTLFAKTLG